MSKKYTYSLKDPNVIYIDREDKRYQLALDLGVPRNIAYYRPFLLREHLMNFGTHRDNGYHILSRKKQIEGYMEMWHQPFHFPYLMCITGVNSDTYAQMVALRLFLRMISKSSPLQPTWHPIYGGYGKDALRDGEILKTSAVFLTNIGAKPSAYKTDKVRDILDRYSHIPRILVSGNMNPIDFIYDVVNVEPTHMMYIGKKKEYTIKRDED